MLDEVKAYKKWCQFYCANFLGHPVETGKVLDRQSHQQRWTIKIFLDRDWSIHRLLRYTAKCQFMPELLMAKNTRN